MKKKLKEDLKKLATQIISDRDTDTIADLYKSAQTLYEKLTVLKFVDEKLNDIEVDVSNNAIVNKFENMANSVLDANTTVPENNPHNEDIIIPGMDTIKDMVSEMPSEDNDDNSLSDFLEKPNFLRKDTELFKTADSDFLEDDTELFTPAEDNDDNSLSDLLGKPNFLKNDTELFMPANEKKITDKSLNDKSNGKEIIVDLNNRLAFVKHLFNGSTEDYNRVLSQLSTIDTKERSISFIENMIKPDYNNWTGKEEYAERFMDLIERRFT